MEKKRERQDGSKEKDKREIKNFFREVKEREENGGEEKGREGKNWYLYSVILTWHCPKKMDLLTFSITSLVFFGVWFLLLSRRGWSHQLRPQVCWSRPTARLQ